MNTKFPGTLFSRREQSWHNWKLLIPSILQKGEREREPSDVQETPHRKKSLRKSKGGGVERKEGDWHVGRGALRAHGSPAKPDGALRREHPYVIWVYVESRPLKTHTHPVSKRCLLGCRDRVKKGEL